MRVGPGGISFSSQVPTDRTSRNSFKLCQGRFRLHIRKYFFMEGWSGLAQLPRAVHPHPCRGLTAPGMWHMGTQVSGGLGRAGEWLDSITSEGFSSLDDPVIP